MSDLLCLISMENPYDTNVRSADPTKPNGSGRATIFMKWTTCFSLTISFFVSILQKDDSDVWIVRIKRRNDEKKMMMIKITNDDHDEVDAPSWNDSLLLIPEWIILTLLSFLFSGSGNSSPFGSSLESSVSLIVSSIGWFEMWVLKISSKSGLNSSRHLERYGFELMNSLLAEEITFVKLWN